MTTVAQRVNRVSVCPGPALPDTGFLLVDPGAFSSQSDLEVIRPQVCMPTNWGRDLSGLPAIVDLDRCQADQRQWLLSLINLEHEGRQRVPLTRPGICAYIESGADANVLARHLADQMLVLPVEKSGQRALAGALWRFFDPRVFANLCWILKPDHLATLVGPASRWVFPWFDSWYEFNALNDRAAELDTEPEEPMRERIAGFARVDLDVWQRAQRISTINQTLGRLSLPSELTWQQKTAAAARVESALIEAEHKLHWKAADDQMAYAEHITRYGAAFRNHPRLTDLWPRLETKSEAMTCLEVIARLTSDEYAALATTIDRGSITA